VRSGLAIVLIFAAGALLGVSALLGWASADEPESFNWEVAALSFTGLATLALGGATVWLGATTRAIERRRIEESHRPHVIPTAIESGPEREGRLLPVTNVGPGAALNISGHLEWRGDGSGTKASLLPTSIGPGQSGQLKVDLPGGQGKQPERVGGVLDFEDITGGRWRTEFFIDEFGRVNVQRTWLVQGAARPVTSITGL
jgi:hypothetical protein